MHKIRAALLDANESKGRSLGKQEEEEAGDRYLLPRLKAGRTALMVKNMNCNSLFHLLRMKASPAQVKTHDVFTENTDLLFSQECIEPGKRKEVFWRNLQLN